MTRGRAGRWLASLVLAVGGLALVEGALRVWGPEPAPRLPYQRLVLPALERVGDAWVTTDPRIAYQELPDEAGPRVAVFGGSATAGLGFSPNAAFPRQLERILRVDHPDAVVLNLGLIAASAREVRGLVADVDATADLDWIVVYSGNNEFLEPLSARYAWDDAGLVDRARLLAAGTRLFGLWRSLLVADAPPVALTPVSAAEMGARVALSPRTERQVRARYEADLRAIVQGARAPVVLGTIATNPAWPDARYSEATPALADIVRRVAADTDAVLCDLAAEPAATADGSFYDHIHFTPAGSARVGAALAACLGEPGDPVGPPRDGLDVATWLGVDPATARDADLWKYQRLLAALDARIAADPTDFDALVARGNAYFFQRGGAGQARSHWEQALALRDDPDVRANLAHLAAQARSSR